MPDIAARGLLPSSPMDLATHTEGPDVLVVALRADRLDAANVRGFRERMQSLLPGHPRVVLDLDGVGFVDSSGLGALIACLRQAHAQQGDLRLCGLAPSVQALFELVRVHRVFHVHPARDEAVEAFAQAGSAS